MTTGLKKVAEKWVDDSFVIRAADIPEVVYHYTDAQGLIGMLAKGVVWATDYRFLNDKSEVSHTRGVAKAIVTQRLEPSEDPVLSRLYAEILSYQALDEASDTFVFSLSGEPDDLSQWRGYARDGQGFTIGLSGKAIFEQSEAAEEYGFQKIEYDHSRQRDILEKALNDIEKEIKRGKTKANHKKIDDAASWFDYVVENYAPLFKHRSFAAEKEWRIVGRTQSGPSEATRVRASGLRLVRYIELQLRKANSKLLPITRIGIGPGFVGSEEVHAVRALCQETGYAPEIYFADTPYRRF